MNFWLPFLSFLITFSVTPLVIKLAKRANIVTDAAAKTHPAHTHSGVLPRGGGAAIFLGIFTPLSFFIFQNKIIGFIFLGALLILIVGLLDDKYNLSPYLRFWLNVLSALLAVLGGIGIPFLTNPGGGVLKLDQFVWHFSFLGNNFELWWLADLLSIFWIVWCMNIINWSKGVDGQQPGFVFLAALFLGLLANRFTRHNISTELVMLLSFCTAASYLGFLPWNFYPQKILPGYSGGALAGYLLSIIAILAWGKFSTLALILVLPFTDAILVFFGRIKRKKSPFVGDRSHFHHVLLDLGWSRRRIAVFYWLITLCTGTLALYLSLEKMLWVLLVLMILFSGIILGAKKYVGKN